MVGEASEGTSMSDETTSAAVEGAGEPSGLGAYPIDTLLIRTDQRTVHDVLRREAQGFFVLDPEFQRAFVWEPERQSRLIESILMRIPLPVFYLAENNEGKLVVVDGLQRLTTLKRFVENEQPLVLDNSELAERRFKDLPTKLQNRVEDAQLTLYIIDAKVPERVRLDIFERVNSGRPLTRQQMRNALYQGAATRFLRDVCAESIFLNATGKSLNPLEMRDREAINRFCGFFLLGPETYPDDMDAFLASALKQMNKIGESGLLLDLRTRLLKSLILNEYVFGPHAFRKHTEGQLRRNIINLSLFDVFSVAFAKADKSLIQSRKDEILKGFFQLMADPDYVRDITYGTSDKARVLGRFRRTEKMLQEALR
jgi:hypothetical protein